MSGHLPLPYCSCPRCKAIRDQERANLNPQRGGDPVTPDDAAFLSADDRPGPELTYDQRAYIEDLMEDLEMDLAEALEAGEVEETRRDVILAEESAKGGRASEAEKLSRLTVEEASAVIEELQARRGWMRSKRRGERW